MRRTLKRAVEVSGVGLHGGQRARMKLEPAGPRTGVCFVRTDEPRSIQVIPARYDLVTDTQLCTRLTNAHGVSVGTVEHIMAALAGTGITDLILAVDGPEVPIANGSAAPFVEAILEAGIDEVAVPVEAIRITAPVRVEEDGKWAELTPADRAEMRFQIEFADAAIGAQEYAMALTDAAFVAELADCRTFGHLHEVDQLRAMGLVRGGSLQNAIVVDKGRVLNVDGLRRPDEFVRHKMLDAVGDLALAGAPIIGRYSGYKAGHGLTNQLLRKLFATEDAWRMEMLTPGLTMGGAIVAPRPAADSQPALAV